MTEEEWLQMLDKVAKERDDAIKKHEAAMAFCTKVIRYLGPLVHHGHLDRVNMFGEQYNEEMYAIDPSMRPVAEDKSQIILPDTLQ